MLERLNPQSEHWKVFSADHIARYQFATAYVADRVVMDAGCGNGYGSAILMYQGKSSAVTGVDIDKSTIEQASLAWKSHNIDFVIDDCESLSKFKSNTIDVVVSFENLEHLSNPSGFLAAAYDKLAHNGILLCSTPDKLATPDLINGKPANPYHCNEWTRDEFLNLLHKDFPGKQIDVMSQVRSFRSVAMENMMQDIRASQSQVSKAVSYTFPGMARRLLGRPRFPQIASQLSLDSISDYPIVPSIIAKLYGNAWCHFAICRKA